jgi:hypothetical protein
MMDGTKEKKWTEGGAGFKKRGGSLGGVLVL